MDLSTYGPIDLWTISGNWEDGSRLSISMRTMLVLLYHTSADPAVWQRLIPVR